MGSPVNALNNRREDTAAKMPVESESSGPVNDAPPLRPQPRSIMEWSGPG
jgi:hypothetical protein